MPKGLPCLITDKAIINRVKAALNNIANLMISRNPDIKVTAKGLYNQLRSVGVDIDLQSVAYIYQDAFASSIGVYSNFETQEELQAYATESVPLTDDAKNALIEAGFGKTLRNGKRILDWVKLMRKSEDEIKSEVENAISKKQPAGTSQADIDLAVSNTLDALKGQWKQIISNAIIKAQKNLKKKDEPLNTTQRTAIDRISDLYAEGLFDEFRNDYENAIRRAVGVSPDNIEAMGRLDDLAKTANLLASSAYGTNNHLGAIIERQANEIISHARYQDAPFVYKAVKSVSSLLDFVLLKILNNPFNRLENFMSGKNGLLNTAVNYGVPESEIKGLAKQVKRDIIRNGGVDFGGVNSMLHGNRSSVDNVRQKLNNFLSEKGDSKVVNWVYNQIMGTAALNGVDSYNKVINTWSRFISGMEAVLMSKGMTKKEAQERMHEEVFGANKWQEANTKARDVINHINSTGGKINSDEQTVARFAADIIKAELINKGLVTSEQLNGTWKAGYDAAGREMGHVPNNFFSRGLNSIKNKNSEAIDKAVKNKQFSKAATLMIADIVLGKIGFRFAGGGTNWIFLKLEKGGIGIITGLLRKGREKHSYQDVKTLSSLSETEIRDTLYEIQKVRDSISRGTIGLIGNSALLFIAMMALGGSDEQKKRKRARFLGFLSDHYQIKKAINKVVPFYVGAYIAKMEQDKIGWDKLKSQYVKQPIVKYGENFFNQNPDFSLTNQALQSAQAFTEGNTPAKKKEKLRGTAAIGSLVSNYLDMNPLPTQLINGGIDILEEAVSLYDGKPKVYKQPVYKNQWDAFTQGVFKYGIGEKLMNKK